MNLVFSTNQAPNVDLVAFLDGYIDIFTGKLPTVGGITFATYMTLIIVYTVSLCVCIVRQYF
jgi:hypothetical protein